MTQQADLKEFILRRNDRYNSFFERLKTFIEVAEDYNAKESNDFLSDVAKLVKEFTIKVKSNGNDAENSTNYLYSFDVESKDREFFIDKIIDGVRNAGEVLVAIELKNTKDKLTESYIEDALEYVEDFAKPKYLNAINLIVQLAKIKKLNILNAELFEMEKDLTACLKYNDKITAIKNGEFISLDSDELSDDFIESAMIEEELVEV